ncbi:MAG: hypothetical protein QM728_10420 [Gordonia sp. (in: high G+C Gram-positive bacteria)]|uniref:hypothetical protein n=1 Tax=Gordonia sp. (in: high G+C Gram-positive bacteria) TaxID=84139 RepID=UPI0039E70BEF
MALAMIGDDFVQLGRRMWVDIVHFAIDDTASDDAVLSSLFETPAFAHGYMGPLPAEPRPITAESIHGKWHLRAITVDSYEPTTAAAAWAELQRWANEPDWTDPGFRQPADAMARLDTVHDLLERGDVYQLRNPDAEDEHECGWVVGITGFHEFVVIDRQAGQLHLIVASDD